jgi:hypothetical protein
MQIQGKSGEFLRLLEEAVACAVDPSAVQVGESVYFLAQYLPLYSTFAASAAQRARILSGLLHHGDTPFARYHNQIVEMGHAELTVLLQRPAERMVEYARLLTALLGSGGGGGGAKSERKMVTVALKAVVDLNDAIEQSRHRDSLQDVEKKTGVGGLFVPGRAYITEGTLRVVYKPKEAKASRLCTFYLCSDLLLIGAYTHGCFEDPTLLPLNKQERLTVERVLPGTYNYEKIFTKGHVERGAGGALRRMRSSISSAFAKGGTQGADVDAVGGGTSTLALDALSSSSSSTADGTDEGEVTAWRQALEQCSERKSVCGQGNQGAPGPFVIHHCFKLLARKRNIYIEAPDPAALEVIEFGGGRDSK